MQRKVLAYYTFLVCDLEFTTPRLSVTSSLLHLNANGYSIRQWFKSAIILYANMSGCLHGYIIYPLRNYQIFGAR